MGNTARELEKEEDEAIHMVHPFVITIYIMAFSLIINHRLNYCYQRYWESCSSIFMMTSKWMDSATTLASFHYQSVVYEEERPRSFGDEDKPLDQLKEKDKKKSAPTGGNTRMDSGEFYSVNEHMDDTDSTSFLSVYPSSLTDSGARKTSLDSSSRRSFVSTASRERQRQFSEAENLSRTKQRLFPKKTLGIENSIRSIFTWNKDIGKNIQTELHLSDFNLNNDSAIFNTKDLNLDSNQSSTPPRSNLSYSHSPPRNERPRGLLRRVPSMPVIHSPRRDGPQTKSIRGHGINQVSSVRPAIKNLTEEASVAEHTGRHRRLPSTDIPKPGFGGEIVKSFRPNPSLDWQRRNRTAMPRNTGIHSTIFSAPVDFDFEKLLLQEERERKEESRKKNWEDGKAKQEAVQNEMASRRWSRSSFQSFKKNITRSSSNVTGEISSSSPKRIASDPTDSRASTLSKSSKAYVSKGSSQPSSDDNLKVTSLLPRLELYDLPSIHKAYRKSVLPSIPSIPKMKKFNTQSRTKSAPVSFSPASSQQYHDSITMGQHDNGRQSSLLQPPVEKLNGRASLFLQEAAHLYSLMSAVALASLRADMEGVSSPLVDYVPGQKFPPVNPEEMQIKILLEKDAKGHPTENGGDGKVDPNADEIDCELRIRVKRNNKFSNIVMFLFGLSRNSRERTIYNASRPFSVLGGISDAEVEMLRKVRGHSAQHALCCLWLREFITREHLNGSTGGVAPPIVARVYQHISDGTQQYNNCRKTAFTDFPFPHAQLTSFFAVVSTVVFPLLFYEYVDSTLIAVVLNFLTLSCFFGIQEVALELEQPFIRYPNDLPLNNYQAQFNEALISSLYGGFHPDAWGDPTDNGGLLGTNYEGDNNSGEETEIGRSSTSKVNSSDQIVEDRYVLPLNDQDGTDVRSANTASTNTGGQGGISNEVSSGLNDPNETKDPKRRNENPIVLL